MRLRGFLFHLHLQLGLGAYVQWKLCDDFSGSTTTWESAGLHAYLEPNGSATQVTLSLHDYADLPECSNGSDITSATLDITLLGLSKRSYTPALDGPCAVGSSSIANQSSDVDFVQALSLSQTIDGLYPLSSFQLELHLYNSTTEPACISAIITPEIPSSTYNALVFGPLAVLLVILVISYCRRLFEEPYVPEEDGSIRLADHDPPVVNGIGNCLQHLQFAFLTACLNFSYPGFFQPALSSLNWLSLFSSSNGFLGGYSYSGVEDGIYVTNGTYGGTYGMEHMVQVLGAPMTMEIWINMLIIVLILLAIAAILVLIHRIITGQLQLPREHQTSSTTQEVIKDTLRMVLTYFMVPVIAISSYQLDHVGELPSYFISLAVLLIVIIGTAYVWLFQTTSTARLATLIFPVPQHTQETESQRRDLRVLVLVHFTLTFVRGIAIGGLQISGASQLAILMGCEIAFLFSILMLLPSIMFSGLTMCSVGRFAVLSLMITYLAPSSSAAKSIASYTILALELFILIVPILLLELWGFTNMLLSRRKASGQAPVYNLRRLQRRSYHLRQLPQRPNARDYVPICVNCGLDPSIKSETSGTLRPPSIADSRASTLRYPRTASRALSESSRHLSLSSRDLSPSAYESLSTSGKGNHTEVSDGFATYDDFRSQRVASRGSYQSLASADITPAPGVDYSVREMDSFYREPRERNFGDAPPETVGSRLMGGLDSVTSWWKRPRK
ncbi:hypothetical protein PFICI_06495 [Pestalotiopsis fici W106-1]|uniref:TRP C-terminal domain-containing protein n=1 Tax=Pestalotiopsis fici (strain W106-1 / CGMCC3.15140) TaxID=1229662 RepID=W3X5T1_PESFW|nr:uncharacterized protein PFICI_06495 [Pestalotiopsis fici W106-1]ETS81493.1 hypothetical protein PFICI_06495 [Pestalotiopsis fici W106-1]